MWAIVAVALAGLTYLVWNGTVRAAGFVELLGTLAGIVCIGGVAVFVLWMLAVAARSYVRNYRIAIPATAGFALVGTMLWQVFSGLGPGGKFVMVAVLFVLFFVVLSILQN
ncbi:hypothetical protein [Micromonospora sp. KC723]|uniref:hypothetical protein n=1 Tax=Micromonospora sp. KC723 TaxID=2530381 RepID=UPI00104503AF|nr:hypothetical protein [Micromonospora sp. KC723]TDB76617.1 hypothetical protein E1165_06195 [Micromonospora sp. KC723]